MLRINEIIKREIADLLERKSQELNCLVSVTEVIASQDLRHAKVLISLYGANPQARRAVQRFLEHNRADLQKKMAHDIILKYTPVLEFIFDRKYEEADRILSLIAELEKNEDQS
jgi:ribosome-binding factor A